MKITQFSFSSFLLGSGILCFASGCGLGARNQSVDFTDPAGGPKGQIFMKIQGTEVSSPIFENHVILPDETRIEIIPQGEKDRIPITNPSNRRAGDNLIPEKIKGVHFYFLPKTLPLRFTRGSQTSIQFSPDRKPFIGQFEIDPVVYPEARRLQIHVNSNEKIASTSARIRDSQYHCKVSGEIQTISTYRNQELPDLHAQLNPNSNSISFSIPIEESQEIYFRSRLGKAPVIPTALNHEFCSKFEIRIEGYPEFFPFQNQVTSCSWTSRTCTVLRLGGLSSEESIASLFENRFATCIERNVPPPLRDVVHETIRFHLKHFQTGVSAFPASLNGERVQTNLYQPQLVLPQLEWKIAD